MMVRTCPMCGKTFEFYCDESEWGYAYDGKLTCSYHCMRDYERADREHTLKKKCQSSVATLYRQRLRGVPVEEIMKTVTARKYNATTPYRLKMVIDNWVQRNPDAAKAIRDKVVSEGAGVTRKEAASRIGISIERFKMCAERVGVQGRKVSRMVYYTQDEIDAVAFAASGAVR